MVFKIFHHKSTDRIKKMPSERSADLALHPFIRGFWTDAEMFSATGATSLGLIKAMQREKLIAPGKYKNANGKLSRAWGALDLFRIALAVDLADETGFSLLVATKILSGLGTARIDHVLSTRETLDAIERRLKDISKANTGDRPDGLPDEWRELEFRTDRPEVLDLKIVNRESVLLLTQAHDDSDVIIETPLGILAETRGNAPVLALSDQDNLPFFYEDERSILVVRLGNLADRPLREAFGTTAYPNVWIR